MVLLKSIIVGILAIFPGVSGSAIAINFGLYDRFFISIRNIKDNKTFLLLFSIGIIIGLFIGSNLLIYLINYKILLYYFLVGIILSDSILIIKKIIKEGKILFLWIIVSFIFSFMTSFITSTNINNSYSTIKMFIGGILFSFGKIFPGISSSFFLLILGIYKNIIIIFTNPFIIFNNFYYYFPFIIGVIIGIILFIILLSYLLENKYNYLYNIIVGFILSSAFSLIPKFSFNVDNLIGILLLVFSFIFSIRFKSKKEM